MNKVLLLASRCLHQMENIRQQNMSLNYNKERVRPNALNSTHICCAPTHRTSAISPRSTVHPRLSVSLGRATEHCRMNRSGSKRVGRRPGPTSTSALSQTGGGCAASVPRQCDDAARMMRLGSTASGSLKSSLMATHL